MTKGKDKPFKGESLDAYLARTVEGWTEREQRRQLTESAKGYLGSGATDAQVNTFVAGRSPGASKDLAEAARRYLGEGATDEQLVAFVAGR